MAANTKPRTSSCFSFLKDALLLPTLNPKLFIPVFVLVTFPTFLAQVTNVLAIQPLTANLLEVVNQIKNMDPSTPEYEKIMEIMKHLRELVIIIIIFCITVLILSFANQVVALFAASSTYSGDRYSLSELISKVIMKGHRIRGPLITIALVTVIEFTCIFLLAALLQLVIRQLGPYAMAAVFVFLLIAFLYINVVFMVAVAVSVADTEHRGLRALGKAWRLMTQVRRKEGCVLVAVIELLYMAPSLLYVVALGYAKKSVAMGLVLLSMYALLSGVVQLFYFAADMVYYYQATDSKDMIAQDYVKIPTGEANA